MSNLPCPIERLADRVRTILRSVTNHALIDEHIDDTEHANITALREVESNLIDLSARRKAARHLEQMEGVTDYTHRLFRAASLDVVDLGAERTKRAANVIAFPTQNHVG